MAEAELLVLLELLEASPLTACTRAAMNWRKSCPISRGLAVLSVADVAAAPVPDGVALLAAGGASPTLCSAWRKAS